MTGKEAVRSIVARAFSPDEWAERHPGAAIDDSPEARDEAARFLRRWEERLTTGAGDPTAFERRLQALGLDRAAARERLTARRLPDDAALPRWAAIVEEVIEAGSAAGPLACGDLTPDERAIWTLDVAPIPLVPELAEPFIRAAQRRVRRVAAGVPMAPAALDPVWRYLLVRLSRIAGRTVAFEVKRASAEWRLEGDTPEARYQFFARHTLGSPAGRHALFSAYPVLARLLAQATLDVADAAAEALRRLRRDRPAIAVRFNRRRDPGLLTQLTPGLSDPHHHGRTVCRVDFESGLTLAYKARSLSSDAVFARLVERWNRRGRALSLASAPVLDRGTHGWCGWVRERPCASRAAVARYYARQGAQLALLHFLCGSDIHRENVVAAGEWPVIIDLEGLAAPGAHVETDRHARTPPAYRSMSTTVLTTGMLPQWAAGDEDRLLEVTSAIGGSAGRAYAIRWPAWTGIGTDAVQLGFEHPPRPESQNLPRLTRRRVPPDRFLDVIVRGFEQGYRRAVREGRAMLRMRGPARLQQCRGRLLVRGTRQYYELLQWSWAPDQLVSGAAYDVALEMLARSREVDPLSGAAIIAAEKRSLWRGDVPVFSARAGSRTLAGDAGRIGPVFPQSAFAQVKQRLAAASEEDLRWQSTLVRAAIRLSLEPAGRLTPVRRLTARAGAPDLLGAAAAIADTFDRLAIRDARGVRWLALARWPAPSRVVQTIVTDPWLHSGTAGTAIFLAHVARATGVRRYAELAGGALEYAWQTWQWLRGEGLRPAASAMTGAGSLVYAFAACGALLGDDRCLDRGVQVAADLAPGDAAGHPDLMGGTAGVLLALLRLDEARPNAARLELARQLGERLLAMQIDHGDAGGWRTPLADRPLAGAAHGAAGIAHALLRLWGRTGETRFCEAALAGFAYERAIFSAEDQDWPNLQSRGETPRFMTGWCAGAPGIGLSRLAAEGLLTKAGETVRDIERDIDAAIAATRRHLGTGQDHLCCGEAGRIVLLAEAGRRGRREAGAMAREAAARLVDVYRRSGAWNLHTFRERATPPSLMSGAAGIGLALLAAGGMDAAGVLLLS